MSITPSVTMSGATTLAVDTLVSIITFATATASNPTSTSLSIAAELPSPAPDPNVLLCDWTRSAADCRDADFIRCMLIASSVLHVAVGLFGIWLLVYRNRGFNRKIATELFIFVGTGIRPKPMDCLIFFNTLACFAKLLGNMPLILDVLRNSWGLRIAIEQLYWIFVSFAFSAYFVGLLYAMPVTTREGIFAIYQPETTFGSKPLAPIHVLTPTTIQKNALLVMGAVYPSIFGAGLGIASGVLRDHGHLDASRIFMLCQYGNWVLILYIMAAMFFYYGLKYTFILRANIIIAEAALKAPRAAFGIGNLKSRSPARFLFIQLQITGFGGCAVTILAGSLCLIWILFQQKILAMEDDQLPHTMAFFWTCAMAATFFVINSLITAQSVRNRKRGLHDPSSSLSGPSSGQGSGGNGTGSLQKHGGPNQNQSYNSKGSKHVMSRFDPEVCLTHESSGDVSTLHSVLSIEKSGADQTRDMNDSDLEAEGIECDHDSLRAYSLPPPPRPVIGSSSFKAASTGPDHSVIRESVFGGRTPREDTRVGSPPQSPTSGGFSLPSFPLTSLRSGSRNSVFSRPSTSSVSGSPSYHTTSTSTVGSRLSRSSSYKHGGSSSNSYTVPRPTSPTSPTYPNVRQPSSNNVQQPISPSSPSSSPPQIYSPPQYPRELSQPVAQVGGAIRNSSNAGITAKGSAVVPTSMSAPISVPLPLSASRGGGGGYRSQGIELETIQYQQFQLRQHEQEQDQYQQQQQQQQQPVTEAPVVVHFRRPYNESGDNGGRREEWSLPPTYK